MALLTTTASSHCLSQGSLLSSTLCLPYNKVCHVSSPDHSIEHLNRLNAPSITRHPQLALSHLICSVFLHNRTQRPVLSRTSRLTRITVLHLPFSILAVTLFFLSHCPCSVTSGVDHHISSILKENGRWYISGSVLIPTVWYALDSLKRNNYHQ